MASSARVALLIAGLWLFAPAAAAPAEDHSAHHRMMAEPPRYARSEARYEIPAVDLLDQDARRVTLASALGSGDPVALNFIFTTCTTICPVMTATFARMQRELGAAAEGLRIVSITVDPEHDTPVTLKEYAGRHGAGPSWRFLTGEPEGVTRVLRAFGAYAGNKTNHRPLTFFRPAGETRWVRIEGLASARDLADEYRRGLTD